MGRLATRELQRAFREYPVWTVLTLAFWIGAAALVPAYLGYAVFIR